MATMEAGAVPRVASPMMPALTPRLLRLATDARLVGLVREGRDGAFEAVYERHHRGILSFCRHMLGDQHEAEDAVQHTFMAAYTDLMVSQKPIHLRPWLFAIARNRCYSVLRSRRERPAPEIEEQETEGLASQVQRRQELRDLVTDLRQLPHDQRAAIVLAELESLSHAEIAEALGVAPQKVKALVFQARESLMTSRKARDTACAEIREQLACSRGGALRRATLRRHLRDCDGCRAFRRQVEHQRKRFGLLLPVAPTLALKEGVLVATVGAGGAAVVGGGGLIASSAIKTGFVKGIAAAIVAGIGTAGAVAVTASNLPVRAVLDIGGGAATQARPAGTSHHRGASGASSLAGGAGAVTQAAAFRRNAASGTAAETAARAARAHLSLIDVRARGHARTGHHTAPSRVVWSAHRQGPGATARPATAVSAPLSVSGFHAGPAVAMTGATTPGPGHGHALIRAAQGRGNGHPGRSHGAGSTAHGTPPGQARSHAVGLVAGGHDHGRQDHAGGGLGHGVGGPHRVAGAGHRGAGASHGGAGRHAGHAPPGGGGARGGHGGGRAHGGGAGHGHGHGH